jgi:flagellar motor switch protein FliM
MAGELLTQDEVDALLKGAGDDAKGADAPVAAGAVRPYDLASQERVVRGRMPALELVNERFARRLKPGLFQFMRRSPEVAGSPLKVVKFGEFLRGLAAPTSLNLLELKGLRGSALVVFDPALVDLVIDNLFGGDGRFNARQEARELTVTEQRIVRKLLDVVVDDYQEAFKPLMPLTLAYQRSESHAQFASICAPGDMVVVSTFTLELGNGGGAFHICIPYASLEPAREKLDASSQGERAAPDRRWVRLVSTQVQSAEVEVAATLATRSITVQELMNVKVGDVLDLELPERVLAHVDDIPIFECSYGTHNGQVALRVEKLIAPEQDKAA